MSRGNSFINTLISILSLFNALSNVRLSTSLNSKQKSSTNLNSLFEHEASTLGDSHSN